MKQTITAVLMLMLLAWAGPAKAWSEDGHRIVCAIAWKELSSGTHALLDGLLEKDPASRFAEACVWADAIRSDPAYALSKAAPRRQHAARSGRHRPCARLSS